MSERKYTDEEIAKAIECCFLNGDCSGCPAEFREYGEICVRCVGKNALEMFNRQNAEIERLTIELDAMRGAANSLKMHYEKAKAEAIKEFAERLHKGIDDFRDKREMVMLPYTESALLIIERKIDNLVAEMTEGK